jgi:transposase
MTKEGIPIAHHVFPGNTADINAFRYALKDVKGRFPLERVIIVADRGVVSENLLGTLEAEHQDYIVGIPLRKWKVADQILKEGGEYQKVAPNLEVNEVWHDGQRYVICYNPEQAEKDRKERLSFVAHLEAELKQGGLTGLAKRKGYGRYLNVLEEGKAEIDWDKVFGQECYDGKYLLRTSAVLSPSEIALAYKGLWRIENAFRELKTGLEIRPCYHWTESRVKGHVAICFLALVIEAVIERVLRVNKLEASISEVLEVVEQIKAVRVEVNGEACLCRTDLPLLAGEAFAALGIRPPPKVLPLN